MKGLDKMNGSKYAEYRKRLTIGVRLGAILVLPLVAPSISEAAPNSVCETSLFEATRTEGTVYLRRDAALNRAVSLEHGAQGDEEPVHEFIHNPVDMKWYTAIWLGNGNTGKLHVSGIADTCEFVLPVVTRRTKPVYTRVIVANPNNLRAQVRAVNESGGNVELRLTDGEYFAGNFDITVSNVNIVAENEFLAVLNGESRSPTDFERLGSTNVYASRLNILSLKNIHQLHIDHRTSSGVQVERLPSVSAESENIDRPWTIDTLNVSPNGGWFVASNHLFVKMPDGSTPSGRVHMSSIHGKAGPVPILL